MIPTFLFPLEEQLVEPVKYYYEMNGKNIRKKLCCIMGNLFNIPIEDIENINNLINVLHNASLVIDDIEDNSILRRKNECAHIKYGIPLALNAGYLTIFKVLYEMNKDTTISEKLKHKIIENVYLTHVGQGMDIYYTKTQTIPSIEEYYKMIEYKTGMIFLSMLDLFREKVKNIETEIFYTIILKFSYFYQIRDDYINMADINYWKERGFCQDVDEQKISFLITYAYNNKLKKHKKILDYLKKKEKKKLVCLFHKNGLFDKIYFILDDLKKEIIEILESKNINEFLTVFNDLPFYKFDINSLNFVFNS